MATVQGTYTDAFESIKWALQANLDNGEELGAAIHVTVGGHTVVDLWGGFADAKRTRPWTEDTIVNAWSTSKTVTALAAMILVDRGLLDLDAPVAKYWPEFAANGKDKVLVRHVLSHTSGVSGWEKPIKYEDVYDLETSTARLATQAPWWEPGTVSGYHAVTHGHLIGEIVRRVTGKTLRDFVQDEIARPVDADYQVGARESDWHRVAEVIPPPPIDPSMFGTLDPEGVMMKSLAFSFDSATRPNTPEFRRAQIGSVNGHTNARALGRIFTPLARGGLLSQKTIDKIFEIQYKGVDLVTLLPMCWGVGFGLAHPDAMTYIPQGRVFFWTGWGGSILLVDFEKQLVISYVMNNMGQGVMGSDRTQQYVEAIYKAVLQK
jgi:CubicO group peptidase (beta-lactamase class C family)